MQPIKKIANMQAIMARPKTHAELNSNKSFKLMISKTIIKFFKTIYKIKHTE